MMRPPRGSCAAIARNAAWAHRKLPVRLVSTTACQSSKLISVTGALSPSPALLNSRSTRP